MDTLGERIAQLRGHRSQTQIARLAGINVSTYNRIERGKNRNPSHETLEKIALAFRVPVGRLTDPLPKPLPTDLAIVLQELREGLAASSLMALGAKMLSEETQRGCVAAQEAANRAESKAEQALRLAARRGRRSQ